MNWKTILPIGLFLAVVFGATVILFNTPKRQPDKQASGPQIKVPLAFETEQIVYEPLSKSRPSRFAQTFYEKSNEPVTQTFWFRNTNPVPIRLKVGERSCVACTTTRVASVDAAKWQDFVKYSALGLIANGGFGQTDLMSALAFAQLDQSLQWKELSFDEPDAYAEIPAAANDKTPTMGLFQMVVIPNHDGFKGIEVMTAAGVGEEYTQTRKLRFGVMVVPPCELTPAQIDVGIRPDNAEPYRADVYYWSPTRSFDELPPPAIAVENNDPFIAVGTPEPMKRNEINSFKQLLDRESKGLRIKSAYHIPVTVYRSRPATAATDLPTEPDIGKFSRKINFAGPNQTTVSTTITGTNVGLVELIRADAIDLGTFNSRYGAEAIVQLVSDQKELELSVLQNQNVPAALVTELSEPRMESGRRYWTLTVTIRKNEYVGELPTNSSVVLQAKTKIGNRRITIEVKGLGTAR